MTLRRPLATILCPAALLAIVALLTPAPSAEASPAAQACGGNLLANSGFEGGFRKTEGEGTSLSSAVSDGWHPWFVRGDATFNREPEFKVVIPGHTGDAYRVRSGQSMKWFTTWGTHTAGIYQRVAAAPGTPLTFSAHGMIYTGEDDGWMPDMQTYFSDPVQSGNYRIAVGIDPTGAVPPIGSHPPASVIWSPDTMTTDQFVNLSVSARTTGSAATVYLKGWAEWPVKHNDSFWDDACLQVGGSPAPVAAEPAPVEPAPLAGDAASGTEGAAAEPAAGAEAPAQAASAPAPEAVYVLPAVTERELRGAGRIIPR